MICLLGVMLSVMCLVSPAPHVPGTACPASALFKETIQVLQKLSSKGSSEITPLIPSVTFEGNINLQQKESTGLHNCFYALQIMIQFYKNHYNNTMEAGGNAAIYLEGFIEALKNSKESVEQRLIVLNLQEIQAYGESCTGWMSALKEHHWKAVEEYDFFNNLEYLLRFLGHNALPEETN